MAILSLCDIFISIILNFSKYNCQASKLAAWQYRFKCLLTIVNVIYFPRHVHIINVIFSKYVYRVIAMWQPFLVALSKAINK